MAGGASRVIGTYTYKWVILLLFIFKVMMQEDVNKRTDNIPFHSHLNNNIPLHLSTWHICILLWYLPFFSFICTFALFWSFSTPVRLFCNLPIYPIKDLIKYSGEDAALSFQCKFCHANIICTFCGLEKWESMNHLSLQSFCWSHLPAKLYSSAVSLYFDVKGLRSILMQMSWQ